MAADGLELRLSGAAGAVRVDELTPELEKESSDGKSLRAKLRGATLVFAAPAKAPRDPAAEKRRQLLASRAEHKAYASLVSSVYKPPVRPEDRIGASLRHNLSVSANMIVAPVAFFFICYLLSRTLVDKHSERVVVGLMGGIAMLFIEMVLYIARTYLTEVNSEKKKRQEQRTRGTKIA